MHSDDRDQARLIMSDIIEIAAPIEEVWAILIDFTSYSRWNPLCSSIDVDPIIGGLVRMVVHDPRTTDPLLVDYALCAFEPPLRLAWEKEFAEMNLRARRDQFLQKADDGRTFYLSTDLYDGPGARATFAEHSGWVRESLGKMGQALAQEVRSRR